MEVLPTVLHTVSHLKNGESLLEATISGVLEASWDSNSMLAVLDALVHSPLSSAQETVLAKKLRDEHASPPPGEVPAFVRAILGLCDRTGNKAWCEVLRETLKQIPAAARADVYEVLSLTVKQSGVLAKLIRSSIESGALIFHGKIVLLASVFTHDATDPLGLTCVSDTTLLVTVAFSELDGPEDTVSFLLSRLAKCVRSEKTTWSAVAVWLLAFFLGATTEAATPHSICWRKSSRRPNFANTLTTPSTFTALSSPIPPPSPSSRKWPLTYFRTTRRPDLKLFLSFLDSCWRY